MGDAKAQAELFHGRTMHQILGNDTEDKKESIGTVGNDEVREDGVSMSAAGIEHLGYPDSVIDRLTGDEIDEITVIGSMVAAAAGSTTIRAGFQFRTEIRHERIKQKF